MPPSLLDPPQGNDATDYTNPVSAALGELYKKVTGYMNGTPEMAFRYADNPVGTETTQSISMPQPTTYAGAVGQYVNPSTGQLTEQGQARLADNPALGFDTGGIGASGLLGVVKGYHGSPHAFDRFDNAAIGSGEGAQAYGYGHYLADSEGVARSYRDRLSGSPVEYRFGGDPVSAVLDRSGDDPAKFLALGTLHGSGNLLTAQQKINSYALFNRDYQAAKEWMDANVKGITEHQQPPGHMYEVNVAAEPEHFLDWDKPLSEQHPKVQDAAYDALKKRGFDTTMTNYIVGNKTGRELHSALTRGEYRPDLMASGDGAAAAAHALHEAGIPGIRYLDAGSRGAGEGSRNTVVFDPTSMEVIRRYGVAGLLGGAAAAGSRVGADGRQEQ